MKPRSYQSSAIRKAKSHFSKNSRGKVVWPCGMGKTFMSVKLAKSMGARKILVCVPSLALVQQSLSVWKSEFKSKDVQWMCVCSDTSVRRQADAWEVEPGSLGITVTTSPDEIGTFLRKRSSGVKIVFTTYQSGANLAEGASRVRFDLGVFDEAHNTAGVSGALFSKLLDDDAVKINRRLFMTATERFYRGKRDDVVSMCDEKVYGATIDSISFKRALDDRQLCDYKIVVMSVTESAVREAILENVGVQTAGGAIEASMAAAALVLRKVVKDKKIKRVISFHSSVDKAKRFAELNEALNVEHPKISPMHVNGSQGSSERTATLEAFRSSKRALMTNCRCLTEGVDVPDVDAVLFADPKKSTVDIVQAVGRAIRKVEGKKMAYVIVPVIVPDEDGGEAGYNAAIDVIRQLGSVDGRIVEYFNPSGDGVRDGGVVEFSGVEHGEVAFEGFSEAVRVKYWDRVSGLVPWLPFEDAREYACSQKLEGKREWFVHCKASQLPPGIPVGASSVYANEWRGWPFFLGYGVPKEQHLDFVDAREWARKQGFASYADWCTVRRQRLLPGYIPGDPYCVYRSSWVSWPDFLGIKNRRSAPKWKFEDAARWAKGLGLGSYTEWIEMRRSGEIPEYIPSGPNVTYRSEWKGWPHFLGYGPVCEEKSFSSFHEAREYARSLGFGGQMEWFEWCRRGARPGSIPYNPAEVYVGEWRGWPDFLGYTPKRKTRYSEDSMSSVSA